MTSYCRQYLYVFRKIRDYSVIAVNMQFYFLFILNVISKHRYIIFQIMYALLNFTNFCHRYKMLHIVNCPEFPSYSTLNMLCDFNIATSESLLKYFFMTIFY
jgi:hypothetical protein